MHRKTVFRERTDIDIRGMFLKVISSLTGCYVKDKIDKDTK